MARCETGFCGAFLSVGGLFVALGLLISPAPTLGQTTITGAGGSFPAPVYSAWLDAYRKAQPGVQIRYFPVGAGGFIRQILEGAVDFGATDGPLSDKQVQGFKDSHGFDVLHFPTLLGAVVPAYNVPGAGELNFTPDILAGIYLGRIANWDDLLLREANPKADMPHKPIVVLHRAEGSGTTYIWANYLSRISDVWKNRVGTGFSINWPVGLPARGNDGIASLITRTTYSLGYVELSYALTNHLTYGRVRNSSGQFVKADVKSIEAAAAELSVKDSEDFRFCITNPVGKEGYPISSFTWVLIPARIQDPNKKKAIVDFLHWALTDGQTATEPLAYGRLPARIASQELTALAKIQWQRHLGWIRLQC